MNACDKFSSGLKRLAAASKERRKKKNDINLRILEFMGKFNIEDLNTKGRKRRSI